MSELVLANELQALSSSIAQFREEQERALLNVSLGKGGRKAAATDLFAAKGVYKNDLARLLDTDVVISPITSYKCGGTKWPSALVANFREESVDLGLMESNGSLWRLIKKEGGGGETRVLLQSSEIGEKCLFLTSQLTLVPEVASAAVWNIKALVPSPQAGLALSSPQSLLVQFELANSGSSSSGGSGGQVDEVQLLVSATSEHGERGIAILSQSERDASKANGDLYQWSLSWEIVREDTVVDGLTFLDADAAEA